MTVLGLTSVGHAYFGRTVLDEINLSIAKGEMVALVGPSGCGKSTLAHIAAGLIEQRSGTIKRRYNRHAMVFQEPSLVPWMTAKGNIEFGMKRHGVKRRFRKKKINDVCQTVSFELEDLDKYPSELSGGMKQRVAIARAVSLNPDFIFFDEPFTALDVALKRRMQDLVIKTKVDGSFSGLFITHDLMEAARIADRIVVLNPKGFGISGECEPPGNVGEREDETIFRWVNDCLLEYPFFKRIHDVDERIVA